MSDPAESSNVPVQPGDVLAGKYRVERVLGAGGMGVVVAALHLELDERVAVKFLLPEVIGSPEAAARFVREARAAVKIKSEHVARVIDVGRLENGAPYMVMEYLAGQDLAALTRDGPLPIEDAVDYVIQACDAMAEAHAAGIVHRDLKPANLFLIHRSDGAAIVKVLDFGISKISVPDMSEASLTKTSAVMGSPYYMSPEQMRSSRDVDHRTDIWALGTILFELLSGRPPFVADSLPELVAGILTDVPPSLTALRAEIHPDLESVARRCLEKSRDARFQNVGQLAAALLPFAPRRSRHTAERVFKLSGTQGELPTSLPPDEKARAFRETALVTPAKTATNWADTNREPPKKSKRTAVAIVGGCVAVGVVVIAAAAVLRSRSDDAPATEPSAKVVEPAAAVVTPPATLPATAPPAPAAEPPSVVPSTAVAPAVVPDSEARTRTAVKRTPAAAAPQKPPEPEPPKPPADPAPPPKREPKRNPLSIDLK